MAATQKRTPCLRLLLSVTQAEDEHRVVEVLQKNGIPLCFEARAKGTAPSELLDAIGLGGTTRVLTAGLLPRANVPAVFGAINKALSYHKRGAGIAVTLPLTGVQNSILQLTAPADCAGPTAEKEEHTMKDHPYALLWVSVKAGHGDEAVDAARKAGARGRHSAERQPLQYRGGQQLFGLFHSGGAGFCYDRRPAGAEIRRHAGGHRCLRPEHPRPRCNSRPAGR